MRLIKSLSYNELWDTFLSSSLSSSLVLSPAETINILQEVCNKNSNNNTNTIENTNNGIKEYVDHILELLEKVILIVILILSTISKTKSDFKKISISISSQKV